MKLEFILRMYRISCDQILHLIKKHATGIVMNAKDSKCISNTRLLFFDRGTTVYLVDRRIDMVPELLSSNLCSLRPDQERLAFSVIWEVTADAEIKKTRFTKSVIRSRRAFTYAEAQCSIDDPLQQNELAMSLRGLNKLAKIMKKNRMDQGYEDLLL